MNKSFITGVTGQTGSFLAEILLERGDIVYGLRRRSSTPNISNLWQIVDHPNFHLVEGDCLDNAFITKLIADQQFDNIFHLAAQSHVHTSFNLPEYTANSIYNSTLYILEAIRHYSRFSRLYFAGTSEMFGKNFSTTRDGIKYQNEQTVFMPQSPYSIAKLAAYHLVRLYRESYDLYAVSGILFNHTSERRGEQFVSRKITKYIASINKNRNIPPLKLGNLYSCRDWGYAPDYARAISLFLFQDKPEDLVIASGETHSIIDLLNTAFNYIGVKDWSPYVEIDKDLYRPAEVDYLCGDSTKARQKLNWKPNVGFEPMIRRMIDHDIDLLKK